MSLIDPGTIFLFSRSKTAAAHPRSKLAGYSNKDF